MVDYERPPRVLVVEDEAELRILVAEVLRDAGYLVTTAADGAEAFIAMESTPPDVVLLDLIMPGKDGWSLLEDCRSSPRLRNIPVGILSGASRVEESLALCSAARAIQKPFDIDDLLDAVRELAEVRAQRFDPVANAA